MTNDFKQYILKNVPTRILLQQFRRVRWGSYCFPTEMIDNPFELTIHCDKCYYDYRVKIIVGKFAYWNPYKGHGCDCYFTQDEVKQELNTREHLFIKRRKY